MVQVVLPNHLKFFKDIFFNKVLSVALRCLLMHGTTA